MAIISRGFSGRRDVTDAKLPPGQYLTTDFPVLSAGPTPRIPLDRWELTIDDGTNVLNRWDWKSFRQLSAATSFVETATNLLTAAGIGGEMIKTERFGPTGDR